MFLTIIYALIPVAFVIFLGWFAGFTKIINNVHSKSFATYVMNFSFPCLLFVITAKSKPEDFIDFSLIIAFAIGLIGMYLISLLIHKFIFNRPINESSQGAFICSFPDMAFMGIPIFISLIGLKSLMSIVIGNIITAVPLKSLHQNSV